jgi:hypothetical protein
VATDQHTNRTVGSRQGDVSVNGAGHGRLHIA